ncbi:hypothetical protein Gotri_003076 [Gossypium trilobum]|uniref:Uncharacterized protein n=1 Tax=Gossypium trilobum TaxID=34281 RepID=A0A7J9FAB4_9ROSI|nr:hypothetical protein [Gossypium trilobum]
MNSLAKFAASQSHNASRRWLASQLFTTSTAAKRCSKSGILSDTKPPTVQEWPRPSKIPYQPKAANSVTLSGYINMPVQFEAASDGKFWAGTVISQNPTYDSPPLWIPIIFEGDLAHTAAFHLKENDHVYIDGQLTADPPSNATRNQASVQVMVRAINFVDESSPKTKSIASVKTKRTSRHSDSTGKDAEPAANTWRDLLDNPKEWMDYREHKLNGSVKPKYPDFKRKDGVHSLWLNSAPQWVIPKLEGLKFDIPKVKPPKDLVEGSWKDLVENPNKWWDNRLEKINGKLKEKYPDFKHKETGKVLWVSDMPTWAESKLPPLNSKKWSGNP